MTRITTTVECPVLESFHVKQVAGMFDVPLEARARETFTVDAPPLDSDWRIGLVVGPSGSGKSTIARRLFDDRLYETSDWPPDAAVVDGMGDRPIKEITRMFTAVGFSSPPSWVKPYRVLSNGERFRCDLARALLSPSQERGQGSDLVVFDEFTSVVDRTVAKFASAAIAKGIRSGKIAARFVGVTCHYDVAEWLAPDWVLDMATGEVARGRLRRPPIELEIERCTREAWRRFARHHYLTGTLSRSARCFLASWIGEPVAFCATVTMIGRKRRWRVSRIVTLPDYQGLGVGMAVMETVCRMHVEEGLRINATASHPAVVSHCRRSPKWRAVGVRKSGSRTAERFAPGYRSSAGRAVASFEYVG